MLYLSKGWNRDCCSGEAVNVKTFQFGVVWGCSLGLLAEPLVYQKASSIFVALSVNLLSVHFAG